jgi:hypothetical protein
MAAHDRRPLGRRLARLFTAATTVSALGLAWLPGQALAHGAFRAVPASGFGRAVPLPFPANAAPPDYGYVFTVSCSRPGYCTAGGNYNTAGPSTEARVIIESAGKWTKAVELRMPPGAPAKIEARVDSVACQRPGTCTAVGNYRNEVTNQVHVYAASEASGHWRQAHVLRLPGNSGSVGNPDFYSVSCTAPGNCVAAGGYSDTANHAQAMVITERRGHWGQATEVTPPANAAAIPSALLTAVACPRSGSCVAVGRYMTMAGITTPMGVVQHNGHWPRATPIKQPSDSAGTFIDINGLSCAGTGKCVAVGEYFITKDTQIHPVSVTESGGHWNAGTRVKAVPPGAVGAVLRGVSCTATGSCVAVGDYFNAAGAELPYSLIRSASGRWSSAVTVRLPTGALTGGSEFAALNAVSCVSGRCVAAGIYRTAASISGMAATRP